MNPLLAVALELLVTDATLEAAEELLDSLEFAFFRICACVPGLFMVTCFRSEGSFGGCVVELLFGDHAIFEAGSRAWQGDSEDITLSNSHSATSATRTQWAALSNTHQESNRCQCIDTKLHNSHSTQQSVQESAHGVEFKQSNSEPVSFPKDPLTGEFVTIGASLLHQTYNNRVSSGMYIIMALAMGSPPMAKSLYAH